MTETTNYLDSWRRYRRLRNIFLALLLGWTPAGVAIARIDEDFRLGGWLVVPLLLSWVLVLLIVGYLWSTWRCPRCGHIYRDSLPYFPKQMLVLPFT